MATAAMSSPKISPHELNGLFEVTIRLALVAAGDEHEHEVGGLGVKGDVADLVDDHQCDPLQAVEFGVQAAVALGVGEQGDPFGGGAEGDALSGQTRADAEGDAQVGLACAGWAEQHDVLFAVEEVELAEVLDDWRLTERWKVKSNSSSVLRAGKRAALMRAWPPWASRLSVSVLSNAAAKRS